MIDKALDLLEELNLIVGLSVTITVYSGQFFLIKHMRNWKEQTIECDSQDQLIAELIKLKEANEN